MDKKVGNQKRKYLIKKETNAIKLKYIELTQSTINYQVKNSSIDRNIESKRKRERERQRKIIGKKEGELEAEGEKERLVQVKLWLRQEICLVRAPQGWSPPQWLELERKKKNKK